MTSQGFEVTYNDTLTKKNVLTKLLGWTVHKNDFINKLLQNKNVSTGLSLIDSLFLMREYLLNKLLNRNSYIYIHRKESNKTIRLWNYAAIGLHMNQENIESFRKHCHEVLEIDSVNCENKYAVIHVRKGDFLAHSRLDNSYYKKSLKFIPEDVKIYFISDDPDILPELEQELGRKLYLSGSGTMKQDFMTIVNSSVIISSNSTFCFWASVLSEADLIVHPDRISAYKSFFCLLAIKN
ncbi:alpha-1,2-fucosyltransferase [Pseudoalteromonas sp. B131b]|uniref:alpha-1,2-fucosyltransferase n=1 Tax=Pseudoalteromonas sp. B131b TaxID=630493 RepID=UPI00301BFB0C